MPRFEIRQLRKGHWEQTFRVSPQTKSGAVRLMRQIQRDFKREGFQVSDYAVFYGKKKVAESKT